MADELFSELALDEAATQLLLAVGHLRGRYGRMMGFFADTPRTAANLRAFSDRWLGELAVDWTGAAEVLMRRGLIVVALGAALGPPGEDSELALTAAGQACLARLSRSRPLHRYEYDLFFRRAPTSAAHAELCRQVYGEDLGQHGLADCAQLTRLCAELAIGPGQRALDAGCGSGAITRWLAEHTAADWVGIDLSEVAVARAQELPPPQRGSARFDVGNLNQLTLAPASFDAIVCVDTLYYVAELRSTLEQLLHALAPRGRLGLLFSQWIDDDRHRDKLTADGTELAQVLRALAVDYRAIDLRTAEREHWDRKLATLLQLGARFAAEGNHGLFQYRLSEAERYASWSPAHRSRYLYVVTK